MEIILQTRVPNLGNLGEIVKVKDGYARNFLLPQGMAVMATPINLKRFEERRTELESKAAATLQAAQERAKKLDQLEIKIAAQASEEGKLYGSIGTLEIARAITEKGIEVAKKEVCLPNGVLRSCGEYNIDLMLHSDVTVSIKLKITTA